MFSFVGCASTPPTQELQTARDLMRQAKRGEAMEREPDEVRAAQRVLMSAEEAHEDDPGSEEERHLAYLADRKIRLAIAHAQMAEANETAEQRQDQYVDSLEEATRARQEQAQTAEQELAQVREDLAEQGDELNDRTEALREREQELQEQIEAREAAEERYQEAMGELEELAEVRQEQNETVITLSGSVLFESGESELRGTATERLNQVAEALKGRADNQIVIEGHTDSRGPDRLNQQLSQARAESVRSYLLRQGVQGERVRAVGRGESEPTASNDSPEGRANNRRVEIHLSRSEQTDQRLSQR